MKSNATLTDLMSDLQPATSPASKLVPRPSGHSFPAKSGRRTRTRFSVRLPWVKWSVFFVLFSMIIWAACEAVQYLREMGVK
jgi:hypothetical protein